MRLLFLVLVGSALTLPAFAVIPQLFGPFQALLSVMPQLLLLLVAGVLALFRFSTWKSLAARLYALLRRHRWVTLMSSIVLVSTIALGVHLSQRTASVPASPGTALASTDLSRWPTFRGNLARTGHLDSLPGPRKPSPLWSFESTNRVTDFASSPAVVQGRLFIGSAEAALFSSKGRVYCLDAQNGEEIWSFETTYPIFSSPVVAEGRVLIGEGLHTDRNSRLYCLDANTGDLLWGFLTTSHVESTPCVVDGVVYVGAGDDGVYALNLTTGEKIWQFNTPEFHVDGSPAVWEDRVLVGTGYGNPAIYALDTSDGSEIWRTPVSLSAWGSPTVAQDRVYVGLGNGTYMDAAEEPRGQVLCLDVTDGDILWSRDTSATVLASIAVEGGTVYAGTRDGTFLALRASDGGIVWSTTLDAPILAAPTVANGIAYVLTRSGRLHLLGEEGALLWQQDLGGGRGLSSPAVALGNLYVGLQQGRVIALTEAPERAGS